MTAPAPAADSPELVFLLATHGKDVLAGAPDHAFYGLYRFKSGFGGRIVHRSGSWDYPLKEDAYLRFRNWETLQGGYEIGCRITPER